nr:MAG TPA: hypothetical protein [Caudoviricetes sp.]
MHPLLKLVVRFRIAYSCARATVEKRHGRF